MKAIYLTVFVVLFAGEGVAQDFPCAASFGSPHYVSYIQCLNESDAARNQPPIAFRYFAARLALAKRAEAGHWTLEQFLKAQHELFASWTPILAQAAQPPPPSVVYVRPPEVNVTVEGPSPSAYQPMRRPNCLSTLGTPVGYATRNQILSNCE
jgi:hypothetical protein